MSDTLKITLTLSLMMRKIYEHMLICLFVMYNASHVHLTMLVGLSL